MGSLILGTPIAYARLLKARVTHMLTKVTFVKLHFIVKEVHCVGHEQLFWSFLSNCFGSIYNAPKLTSDLPPPPHTHTNSSW